MRIRNWVVAFVLLLAVAVLAACGPAVAVPDRDVDVSVETALSAQEKAMVGVPMGQIDLSESGRSRLCLSDRQWRTGGASFAGSAGIRSGTV